MSSASTLRSIAAYGVHAYTASGVLLAALSTAAVLAGRLREALIWLAVAVFVDATDGALARLARVDLYGALIDGARLDDIVDYLTYVAVPVCIAWTVGALPADWAWLPIGAVLLSSAFGFSRRDAKTADHFFTGFPSYWNIVVLYGLAWQWRPTVFALVLVAFAVAVFVPLRYVYPSRTPAYRTLTIVLTSIWGVQVLAMIWWIDDVPRWLLWSTAVYPLYYLALSLHLQRQR
jgi:phosphatidylcholine synthase